MDKFVDQVNRNSVEWVRSIQASRQGSLNSVDVDLVGDVLYQATRFITSQSIARDDSPGCCNGARGRPVGLGSILGALILASLRCGARKGYQHQMGILIWVGALSGFAVSSLFLLSVAALFLHGMGQSFVATTSITLLQTRVPEQMRGRVMSLNTLLLMGIRPLGISRLRR